MDQLQDYKNKFDEVMGNLVGRFAFHLHDTHGYPLELFKESLSKLQGKVSLGDFLCGIQSQHPDFEFKI